MPVSTAGFIALVLTSFVASVLIIGASPILPSGALLPVLGCAGVLMLLRRRTAWVGGALLGCFWSAVAAEQGLGHRIDSCVEGTTVELTGSIVGLPRISDLQTQFDLLPTAIEPWPACAGLLPRRLRLSWFGGPSVVSGEQWQLRVRLRGIRGYQNPGGFDYEAWAFANHIDGSGSVRFGERRMAESTWSWDLVRSALRTRLGGMGLQHPGIVLGLLTGDGGLMSDADWALFRATGTVHLMVISGLHLAIAAGVGIVLGRGTARLFPNVLRRRGAMWMGAISGIVLVTLYAGLGGWGVPVQRAWVATVLVLLALTECRRHSLPSMFVWVGAVVLANDPLAPLQAGFWLSFGAVAVLLAHFAPRLQSRSAVRDLLLAQIVLGCAMVPLLLATIGGVAWLAPLANLVAVPLVSVVMIPMDLLAGALLPVWPSCSRWLFGMVDVAASIVVAYLQALAVFDWSGWRAGSARSGLFVSALACAMLLLPMRWRYRALLLPCVLLPIFTEAGVADSEFRVLVLDVGQGLSVIIDTARHRLLYDAGPHFPTGLDLGSAVVVPGLRHTGPARLDLAILSHADIDHVGGYPAVAAALPVRALFGGQPVPGFTELQSCRGGQSWQWDGVRFRILHPVGQQSSDNDRSCVLLIDNGRARVLLPGDISSNGESAVRPQLAGSRVDVLVAAHHGSRSASTTTLLRTIAPRHVVVSAGHKNRFGHPHREVVCRLLATGARIFVTAQSGAVAWRSDRPSGVIEWRRVAPPYWRVGYDGFDLVMNRAECRGSGYGQAN